MFDSFLITSYLNTFHGVSVDYTLFIYMGNNTDIKADFIINNAIGGNGCRLREQDLMKSNGLTHCEKDSSIVDTLSEKLAMGCSITNAVQRKAIDS